MWILVLMALLLVVTPSFAEQNFSEQSDRAYNVFNPASRYAQAFAPDHPVNPANRFDPGNPVNPTNRYATGNPFNPVNQYHPDNPLNPANRYNPTTSFAPLNPSRWPQEDKSKSVEKKGDRLLIRCSFFSEVNERSAQ